MFKEDGSIEKSQFFVERWKCSLVEIKKRRLWELDRFVRSNAEKDVNSMSKRKVVDRLGRM